MLKAYLARQKKLLGLCAVWAAIFVAVAVLYRLPIEPVLYGGVLAAAVGVGFLLLDYGAYARRCRAVEQLCAGQPENAPVLPEPADRLEAAYQQLTNNMGRENADREAAMLAFRREQLDYYTLWAHQIKTPIAAMHLLLQQPAPALPELDAELLKIEQYVEMVLTYQRLGSESNDFVFRRQPLDEILHGAVKRYARLFILKQIALDYTDTGTMVLTDAKWLRFVVEQLLSNALKYTPPGGRVSLRVAHNALLVADSGIGIRAEDLPRIFERGYTGANGRAETRATGLGLYLCSRTAEKLHMTLAVDSAPGQGTTVRVGLCTELPAYE